MAVHKLNIDEFDEIDYQLLAIHTPLEDYRLAFLINQKLPVLLSRNKEAIQITAKSGTATLSRFSFENAEKSISWNLLQNQGEIFTQSVSTPNDLFSGQLEKISHKTYLLPELKKVDYFLRLQNTDIGTLEISDALQQIEQISMAYVIDIETIKSKNNLIF